MDNNENLDENLDEIDKGFLLLFSRNLTSSYGIWVMISKNPSLNIRPMAYNNVNKRILQLARKGYLEEIVLKNKENLHGRKDYRLTIKGLEQVLPHFLEHPLNIHGLTMYMDDYGIDKRILGERLLHKIELLTGAMLAFIPELEIPKRKAFMNEIDSRIVNRYQVWLKRHNLDLDYMKKKKS